MSQTSPTIKLLNSIPLNPQQIMSHQSQHPKPVLSNQKVLLISTPIKLKDGTIKCMEQRFIPLKIENNQVPTTPRNNKNNIVPLKWGNDPPPLTQLSSNQLPHVQLPTFVRNGQVLRKLIPCVTFPNNNQNSMGPSNTVAFTPVLPVATATQVPQHDISNQESKLTQTKLHQVVQKDNNCTNVFLSKKSEKTSKFGSSTESGSCVNFSPTSEINIDAIKSSGIYPRVKNIDKQLITVTDIKPTKRIHLALKKYNDTNGKPNLNDNWKPKSNPPKTLTSISKILQSTIAGDMADEIDKLETLQFVGTKVDCNYDNEDFDTNGLLEKDPLDIDGISSNEVTMLEQSLENTEQKREMDSRKPPHAIDDKDSIHKISKSERNTISKAFFGSKDGKKLSFEFVRTLKKHDWSSTLGNNPSGKGNVKSRYHSSLKKGVILLRKNKISSLEGESSSNDTSPKLEPIATVIENAKELDPNITAKTVSTSPELQQDNADNNNKLFQRFNIHKEKVTNTEAAMLSYICNLRQKLAQSYESRTRVALGRSVYLNMSHLSIIQKRFIQSQLRNSSRVFKRPRFTKTEISMARDILKAVSPRGYSNLRKLFVLPVMSSVVKKKNKR